MPYENIPFKSYCWSLGTTSFRTKNFSQKIERQLEFLSEFWQEKENRGQSWERNSELQGRYHDFIKARGFVAGDAKNKPKDARETTSGLVDIGLISEGRHLTEAGQALLAISRRGDFSSDNVLQIPRDSYIYFKQLLKTSCSLDGKHVRPFLVLAYLLDRLEYLTAEEYTYLLPLCIDREMTMEIAGYIEKIRRDSSIDMETGMPFQEDKKSSIDRAILHVLMNMENYKSAKALFLENPVSKDLFRTVGMNRKSRSYDDAYEPLYHKLYAVCHEGKVKAAAELYQCTTAFQSKIGGQWRKLLFDTVSIKAIEKEPSRYLKDNSFCHAVDEREFKELFFQIMHLFKARANLSDYQDLNKRYIKNTDMVLFEDSRVIFDIIPGYYFQSRIKDLFPLAFKKSENLFSNCGIEDISPCLAADEEEIIRGINQKFGAGVATIDEARGLLEQERYQRLNRLIDTRFTDKELIRLLDLFEARKDDDISRCVTDNADIPTIFEYILGIIWYKISEREGKILDYMKLSLEADLLPKTHAAGGEADIVYEYGERSGIYPAHTLLLEATLAQSTAQRNMEMEPVSRHLGQHLLRTGNRNSYCIFSSNKLNINVMADFRCRKYMQYFDTSDYSRWIEGMKIIPVETTELKTIIASGHTYKELYPIFEAAYQSEKKLPKWYEEEIADKIEGKR
ncbi:AlwI family type II restriction endonuclease [Lachnospiraceae bacterium 62-35]